MIEGHGFTYRGIHLPNVMVMDRGKAYWAPRNNEAVEVRGRPGALFRRRNIEPLPISVKVLLDGEEGIPFAQTAQDFADWLNATEPQPLIFDADPLQRTYYAILDGGIDPEEVVQYAIIELNFICYDPHAYGTEQFTDITDGGTVTVRGSAPSVPITEVTLSGPTTFVAVGDGDQINMVGTPLDAEQKPYVREERKFWDQMATTTGWSGTTTSDDGPIVGTIGVANGAFVPTNFGTGSGWHGPGLKKTLGQPLQDFKVDAMMHMRQVNKRVGAVHVLMLDAANNIVAKLNVLKNSLYDDGVWVRVRLGNRTEGRNVYSGQGGPGWRWLYFEGRVSLERVGDIWTMSAMRYTPERGWHAGVTRQIRDRDAYALAPVTQIQVNFWQHGTKPTPSTMSVSDLKVYQVNDRPEEIPYIGEAGDVFEFNHQEGTITKNGVNIEDKKAFIGDYFELSKGSNMMLAEPAESISRATVRWRDRWI